MAAIAVTMKGAKFGRRMLIAPEVGTSLEVEGG